MSIDPFTQISRAILSALQSDPDWSALVKPGNVIDMTSDTFERFKGQLQPADVPEVVLLQGDFHLTPFGPSSRLAEFQQDYHLIVTHDSLCVLPLNQLKFQTLIALSRSGPNFGLQGLVRSWEITQADDDPGGKSPWRRNTTRWVSTLTIRVTLYLIREALAAV
jgi:hypothetical protein